MYIATLEMSDAMVLVVSPPSAMAPTNSNIPATCPENDQEQQQYFEQRAFVNLTRKHRISAGTGHAAGRGTLTPEAHRKVTHNDGLPQRQCLRADRSGEAGNTGSNGKVG